MAAKTITPSGEAAITCDILRGRPAAPKQQVGVFRRPGHDGYGAQKLGEGESEFNLTAVLHDTQANVESWAASLEALPGKFATVINDWNTTFNNCLIAYVSVPVITAYVIPGTSTVARGEVRIRGVQQPA